MKKTVAALLAVTPGLSACVEQPTALASPSTGQFPCELLPPGFAK